MSYMCVFPACPCRGEACVEAYESVYQHDYVPVLKSHFGPHHSSE
jgi:hypothetical protein